MSEGERTPYLGTELPDGRIRIEKFDDDAQARKRMVEILDKEKLPVTSTLAENLGTAALKIAVQSLNREKSKQK
jgi:hypothetical protein